MSASFTGNAGVYVLSLWINYPSTFTLFLDDAKYFLRVIEVIAFDKYTSRKYLSCTIIIVVVIVIVNVLVKTFTTAKWNALKMAIGYTYTSKKSLHNFKPVFYLYKVLPIDFDKSYLWTTIYVSIIISLDTHHAFVRLAWLVVSAQNGDILSRTTVAFK